jgi:catechol 2,3-dioxygenase-like lactoylglutathione lyase family enzyme
MRKTIWCLAALLLTAPGCKRERRSPFAEAARACLHDDAEMSCPRPIFNVRSLAASQRYYRDVLGFKVDWEYGDPPDFGSVSRADAVLFLAEGYQGTPGAWTMIFTQDVDRLHGEYARKRALIRMPPKDMPWRMREMHVSDLDGNVIRFGTGIDHDD